MRFNQNTQETFRFSNNTSVYRKACFGAERDGDKLKQRGHWKAMNHNQGDAGCSHGTTGRRRLLYC